MRSRVGPYPACGNDLAPVILDETVDLAQAKPQGK
jgi:hypothetical protein